MILPKWCTTPPWYGRKPPYVWSIPWRYAASSITRMVPSPGQISKVRPSFVRAWKFRIWRYTNSYHSFSLCFFYSAFFRISRHAQPCCPENCCCCCGGRSGSCSMILLLLMALSQLKNVLIPSKRCCTRTKGDSCTFLVPPPYRDPLCPWWDPLCPASERSHLLESPTYLFTVNGHNENWVRWTRDPICWKVPLSTCVCWL